MKHIVGMYVYDNHAVVTSNQTANVEEQIGVAFKIELSYSNSKVTAVYKNYLNEVETDFNGEIMFEFAGEKLSVLAVNGIAEIDFTITDSGTYIVKTVNPEVENGEVTING